MLAQALTELATNEGNERFILSELARAPAAQTPVLALEDAYARTVVDLRAASSAHLVSVQSLSVGNRQLDAKGVRLAELAEPVAIAGNLRRLRLQVKGRYESLERFHAYLDRFKAHQAVIRSLEITKDQFQADVLVLGV